MEEQIEDKLKELIEQIDVSTVDNDLLIKIDTLTRLLSVIK